MRAAGRYHLTRGGALAALVATVTFGVVWGRLRMIDRQAVESAGAFVTALLNADTARVAELLPRLADHGAHAEMELAGVAADGTRSPKARLHASLALLPRDPTQLDYLRGRLLSAEPDELILIRAQLQSHAGELSNGLWKLAANDGAPDGQRFRACCALALFDANSEHWGRIATHAADQLVAQSVRDLGEWMTALRPAREALLRPLVSIFSDEARDPGVREIAATVLADYAASDAKTLAELALVALPRQLDTLLPKLAEEPNRGQAIKRFEAELLAARPSSRDWNDPPFDPAWDKAGAAIEAQLAAAAGLIDERWAFCQTLPIDEFEGLAERLRAAGYRPSCLRPYVAGDRPRVAAIWRRDGAAWRMALGLTADETVERDRQLQADGFAPCDVAGYRSGRENDSPARFAVLWVQQKGEAEGRRLRVDRPDGGAPDGEEGHPTVLQRYAGPNGEPRYAGIWRDAPGQGESSWEWDLAEPGDASDEESWQVDVSVARADAHPPPRPDPSERLVQAEKAVEANPDDPNSRLSRGMALFDVGNDVAAIADLTYVAEKKPQWPWCLQWRAQAYARLRRADEARADVARFAELRESASSTAYLAALVSARLGEPEAALARLEALLAEREGDASFLYAAACAVAMISPLVANDRREALGRRALDLLTQAEEAGDQNPDFLSDTDLDALHDLVGFKVLVGRRYARVFATGTALESIEIDAPSPESHLARARELVRRGYRPQALSLAAAPSIAAPGADGAGAPLVAIVAGIWLRPTEDPTTENRFAARKAHAAAALARLKAASRGWPSLAHSADPAARTAALHALAPLGVDPNAIVERLFGEREGQREKADKHGANPGAPAQRVGLQSLVEHVLFDPETSIRRALILALGEYDERQFPKAQRELVAPKLLALYREDPDAGIHGACEWLLRRWLQAPALAAIDAEMISPSALGARRWYVNAQGQTLAVVAGPVEFRMGNRVDETDRVTYVGHETSHLRRIGRSFAIATKEVTWREFTGLVKTAQFSNNPHHVDPDDPDYPVREVSWYDAAHYCNRLSEKVGLSKDQWCYQPNEKGEYAAGMRPAGNYLERSGYRLPTEAEWEFACRAGAASDYCFGDDPTRLRYYAWYDVSAKLDTQSLDVLGGRLRTDAGLLGVLEAWEHSYGHEKRVGRLKPNDLGLFDMHGNIFGLFAFFSG